MPVNAAIIAAIENDSHNALPERPAPFAEERVDACAKYYADAVECRLKQAQFTFQAGLAGRLDIWMRLAIIV